MCFLTLQQVQAGDSSTRIRVAGIIIWHARGYIVVPQGLEMDQRELTSADDRRDIFKRRYFSFKKVLIPILWGQNFALGLLVSMMKPTRPAEDES